MANPLKPIVVVGASGYAQEVAWVIDALNCKNCEWNFLGFIDPTNSRNEEHYGRPVLGGYDALDRKHERIFFACGIGAPTARLKECLCAEAMGWQAVTLIHPSVIRAQFVSIGDGSVIGAGTVLAPYAHVGRHCAINVQTTIGPNSSVGDFSVISPGARILGGAVLKERAFIPANASVYPRRPVGDGTSLVANSFWVEDLAADQSALGGPARPCGPPKPHQASSIHAKSDQSH